MDTDRLRYFVTVVEAGSLTKASLALNISHSGLSKAISTLQSEIQTVLFRPAGRGLEITEEGKWFYQKALAILSIADEINRGPTVNHVAIRIGLSSLIATTCAGRMAEALRQPLVLHEIDVGELEGKILSDELDFGIAFVPTPVPELDYLKLGEVAFSSFARSDLVQKFNGEPLPYIVPISDLPTHPAGYRSRDGWPKEVTRRPHYWVRELSIALDLLKSGHGAAYMPDFIAKIENRDGARRIVRVAEHSQARTKRALFLVKRQTKLESKEMKQVSNVLRKICCARSPFDS